VLVPLATFVVARRRVPARAVRGEPVSAGRLRHPHQSPDSDATPLPPRALKGARGDVDYGVVTPPQQPPDPTLKRPLAAALGALGVVTFIVAALVFLLTVNARDFCDDTCNQGAQHLWIALSAIAALSSLTQVVAAIGRARTVALAAFGVTLLVLGIPLLLVILFS